MRQREHAPVIQRIGDIFLDAATEFRLAYPIYVGHHPLAEKRMKEELDANPQFRLFVEVCGVRRCFGFLARTNGGLFWISDARAIVPERAWT